MSKQTNKAQKRRRREAYIKRKKSAARNPVIVRPSPGTVPAPIAAPAPEAPATTA